MSPRVPGRERDFVRTEDGIHLVSPLNGEYTLCGDAFDRDDSENEPGAKWYPTTRRVLTCPKCVAVAMACRGVRCEAAEPAGKVIDLMEALKASLAPISQRAVPSVPPSQDTPK